ncbi:DUF4185 domain-containing protein [Jiangella alba]|uniref:DUF4185 domain-containing protein n=1 Tax=Jiangella alba TaxID=561176 RepID=A0A1H5JIQ7_9ACTN|nr:DUF4185 domain-containing protein [Jiangella alba]SEE52453.1 protein of unknown function [Jiangella alba]
MSGRATKVLAAAAAALTMTASLGAVPATATTAPTPAVMVGKITGPGSQSNTHTAWGIYGTDLGVMWDNGDGEILAAFGDTFGNTWTPPGGNGNDWRSNVLLRSSDTDLSNGMTFDSAATDSPGHAKELIPSLKVDGVEMTVIPTAGVSVGTRQYMAYMSVRHWGPPGEWDTNYAAIAYSDDNGENWVTTGAPTWDNPTGDNKFQMGAFVRHGGYVYLFATPNGRNDDAFLARVPEASVLTKSAYTYWNGSAWVSGADTQATPVLDGPVAELSVRYDAERDLWITVYMRGTDIVLRSAENPTGPWSAPQVIVSDADHPGPYGGFIHPWSSGDDLYFALSQWNPYNVYLMRVSLDADANVVRPNLVADPSFERQPGSGASAPWSCTGNCGVDASIWGFSGDRNGFVRYNSGWHDLHQEVAVTPGTDYVLTAWLRTSSNNDNGFVGVRAVGGPPIAETNFASVGPWTRFTVPFNSGGNTAVEVFTGVWTDNGDMWVQVDDYAIVEAP